MSKKVIAAIVAAAAVGFGARRLQNYLMGKGRLADYIRSEDSPLETAVRVFGNGGQEIHLAGAIHLAEQGYFDAMRQRLDSLDLVLYEAVKASPGSTPDYLALLRRAYKVGAAQLGLAYQMEAIDYEHLPLNWEHCDLSEREMAASSKGLLYNQAFTSSALYKELIRSFEEQLDDAEQSLGQLAPGSTQKVRSLAGKQMVRMLTSRLAEKVHMLPLDALLGKGVILEKRNAKVTGRLDELIAAGTPGNIGVFYGAAHLPGIEDHLKEKGFSLSRTEWQEAWS